MTKPAGPPWWERLIGFLLLLLLGVGCAVATLYYFWTFTAEALDCEAAKSCGELSWGAQKTMLTTPGVVWLVCAVVMFVQALRRGWVWWVPLVGAVVAPVVVILAGHADGW